MLRKCSAKTFVSVAAVFAAASFAQPSRAESLYDAATREGFQARANNNFNRAIRMFETALAECDESGKSERLKIVALNNLADTAIRMNALEKANTFCVQALALCSASMPDDDPLGMRTKQIAANLAKLQTTSTTPAGRAATTAAVPVASATSLTPPDTIPPSAIAKASPTELNPSSSAKPPVQDELGNLVCEIHQEKADQVALPPEFKLEVEARQEVAPTTIMIAGHLTAEVKPNPNSFFWLEDQPDCEKDITDGVYVETIRGASLRISASLFDTDRKTKVLISIRNDGDKTVEIDPSKFTAGLVGKKSKRELKYEDPYLIANKLERSARTGAAWANFGSALGQAGAAMQRVNTYAYTNTSGSFYGRGGYGTYYGSGTTTISSPDYAAQARAAQQAAITRANSQASIANAQANGAEIIREALKGNTIKPGNSVSGFVHFQRKGKGEGTVVVLPIEAYKYHFSFSTKNPTNLMRTAWYGADGSSSTANNLASGTKAYTR